MIIKKAFTFQTISSDNISLSFPGQTNTFSHYPSLANLFYQGLAQTLAELGIDSTYDCQTGLGTIAGVPMMIIYKMNTVYFWCEGMGSSCNSISLSYTSIDSEIQQSIGFTVKGTINSFVLYIGSGSSVGAEKYAFAILSMKRLSDDAILKGFLVSSTTPVLYTIENGEFLEKNAIVKPATDYANSGSVYGGYALVPAVTTSMAYEMLDCYMGTTLLADASYYTIAGVSVVVVDNYLLLKC